MDISKVLDILGDSNIDKKEVFKLVDLIKNVDLEDEDNLRSIIKKACIIAKKDIDEETTKAIIKRVQTEGLSMSLLDYIK